MPCDYKCIFGISNLTPGLDSVQAHNLYGDRYSHLHVTSTSGRIYWFLFVYLGKTYYDPNIPRFTKQDEEQLDQEHWNDKISVKLTFDDLYKNRRTSILTAVPEYSYHRWYFGRIMTIGDAAHKFEPLTGQGGNSAIETAATLANSLTTKMKKRPTGLSKADFAAIFQEVQDKRETRVKDLIKGSHDQQRNKAGDTPFLRALAWLLPKMIDSEDRLT